MTILEAAGIRLLTGEACPLNMRILCDLTPEGCEMLTRFLGGAVHFEEGKNWNSGAVSSIMLPRSCLEDLERFVAAVNSGKSTRNVHQMSGRVE